jgi:hypothetical protein
LIFYEDIESKTVIELYVSLFYTKMIYNSGLSMKYRTKS